MTLYNLLLLIHILLFVYWVGADLGVFYASFFVLNRELSVETRSQMAKVLFNLDLAPRICLVLMLPVGLSLASQMGISPVTGAWLGAVWVASLIWLAVVLRIHSEHGSPRGLALARADGIFRGLLVVVLAVVALWSLLGGGPFVTTWLPVKVLLFAVAVGSGLGIRIVLRPFGPAFQRIIVGGSAAAAAEEDLASAMKRTYPLVFAIWAAVIGAAAMGVMKV